MTSSFLVLPRPPPTLNPPLARPSTAPSSELHWGLTLIEPLRSCFLGSNWRSRSDGRKQSIPSSSRTLAARRGAPSINSLAGLDAPCACTPSRQTPSLRQIWIPGHTALGAEGLPRLSTCSCPTYGRFQHLRVTVSLILLSRRHLQLPSGAWSQEGLRDWIPYSRSLYSTPGRVSSRGFAISSLPAYAKSKYKRSGEENK